MQKITVFTDGGARGNPGPAASAFVINGDTTFAKYLGTATNNQAEYIAVVEALKWILNHHSDTSKVSEVEFFLDSQLVVEQLKGNYKIKNEGLKPLYLEIQELINGMKVTFTHVPREKNKIADRLVNEVLDKQDKQING